MVFLFVFRSFLFSLSSFSLCFYSIKKNKEEKQRGKKERGKGPNSTNLTFTFTFVRELTGVSFAYLMRALFHSV